MKRPSNRQGTRPDSPPELMRETHYSRLFRKFVLLTMVCSLVPLLAVGWGINIHYTRLAETRVIEAFKTQLMHHRKSIELFLNERTSKLKVISRAHSLSQLVEPARLSALFVILNNEDGSFTDLGVIDGNGRHLAYVGPFDLMNKNYAETLWFKEVMEKGVYISDMFTGFRRVPHFIIAVVREEDGARWILRATVDTEVFRSLVENTRVGTTGEVLLINQEGRFQSDSRFIGKVMEQAPFPVGPVRDGIQIDVLENALDAEKRHVPRQIAARTWLLKPHWMLMIRQDYAEALGAVAQAKTLAAISLHLSALIILIATVLVTRHMITVIRQRDLEVDQLNHQVLQASKLASIGELSAGVAHEINNPLAIILTEKQILMDMQDQTPALEPDFRAQLLDSMGQIDIQIQRCKRITHNLLRFARRTQSLIETVDLNGFIKEIVELMEREARTSGIEMIADLEAHLPEIQSDPSQLQQVFLNMITNALDAHDGKPYGAIRITTRSDDDKQGVRISIADTGSGIRPENLDKLFDPFFTTKPVGKGTGLGLSICYSIVTRLGGDIRVNSVPGEGSEFAIFLPCAPPAELKERIANEGRLNGFPGKAVSGKA